MCSVKDFAPDASDLTPIWKRSISMKVALRLSNFKIRKGVARDVTRETYFIPRAPRSKEPWPGPPPPWELIPPAASEQ